MSWGYTELDLWRAALQNPSQDLAVLCKILLDKLSEIYEYRGQNSFSKLVNVKWDNPMSLPVKFILQADNGQKAEVRYERSEGCGRRWRAVGDGFWVESKRRCIEELGVTHEYLAGIEDGLEMCFGHMREIETSKNNETYYEMNRRRRIENSPHFVYLIRCGSSSYYKIGVTSNVATRLSGMQSSNPFTLSLAGQIEFPTKQDAFDAERQFHKKYKNFCKRGEWFYVDNFDSEWTEHFSPKDFKQASV